ncbi:MAG: LamG domain-containing protein [Rhodospirillaceae bacterium]
MRQILHDWSTKLARDDGVAGIVIAMIIAILAFTSATVFFSRTIGPARDLKMVQDDAGRQGTIKAGIMAYFLSQSPNGVPCPDLAADGLDGVSDACGGTATTSGALPWSTLGLSEADARDAYGRYYTYVVVSDSAVRQQCDSVAIAAENGGGVAYTGEVVANTALIDDTSGEYVLYAVIGHGKNGYGARTSASAVIATTGASAEEIENATSNTTSVNSGAVDDTVLVPESTEFSEVCEQFTEGGQLNASMTEDFSGSSFDPDKLIADGDGGAAPTQSGGQANFTAAASYIATADAIFTSPGALAIYASAYWTPAANDNSFSIATRASLDDKDPDSDDFTSGSLDGITFRFGGNVLIRDSGSTEQTGGDLDVIAGRRYFIEVYDNGYDLWGRITDVANPDLSAEVRLSGNTEDLGDEQKVVFINRVGSNALDSVVIGTPMLSLTGYAEVDGDENDNAITAGTFTIEAWIRPRSFPSSGEATIVSQWDESDTTDSSYRLYMDSTGALSINLQDAAGGAFETQALGISTTRNEWTHVAVTYQAGTGALRAYQDGALISSTSNLSLPMDGGGVRNVSDNDIVFAVGADGMDGAAENIFTGDIADVRLWDAVRTASNIASCYKRRLPAEDPCDDVADIVVNWMLDPIVDGDGAFSDNSADAARGVGEDGDLDSAAVWTPTLANYVRPTADQICPGFEGGLYHCEFRGELAETDVNVPTIVGNIYFKVWGGGGGGHDDFGDEAAGGGGGFAAGMIENTDDNGDGSNTDGYGRYEVEVGAGGDAGDDGEDSRVEYGGTGSAILIGRGGEQGSDDDDGDQGSGDADAAENGVEAPSLDDEDGAACVPAGDPCTDPHYADMEDDDLGRGGAAGDNAGFDGVIVLLW